MLIPIGHDQEIRKLPYVTIAIIAVCTLVQLYTQFMAPGVGQLQRAGDDAQLLALLDKLPVWRFGYHTDEGLGISLITSAFVHAGWFHLIGNMLFLWLAGSVLEDRWGGPKYLVFYLASAVVANLVFKGMYHGDGTILVGASGAISGAMGAFLIFYGGTEITFWYWLYMRTGTFRLAAFFALPLWLAEQVLWVMVDGRSGVSGVAYPAHIGGFVFGLAFGIASNMIFGKRGHDDSPPIPVATAAGGGASPDAARYDKCMDAILKRDLSTTRSLASRVIIDQSRAGEPAKIVAIYTAIAANLSAVPITDGAFSAAAVAAEATHNDDLYVRIANDFDREQPLSAQLPKVLWRLAQHHRDAGRVDQAVATLESLAQRFPHDPFGTQARDALASRR